MNKSEVVEKVREVLGVDPQPENEDGRTVFELNGVYLCHVTKSGAVSWRCGGAHQDYFDFSLLRDRVKNELYVANRIQNVKPPVGDVVLTEFHYAPGGKWDCGFLNLKAETPLGLLVWEEVVPGPRHGEDSWDLVVTLNGVELDLEANNLPLDFEPPGKPGKWADKFADSEDEVSKELSAWFEANKLVLACLVEGQTAV